MGASTMGRANDPVLGCTHHAHDRRGFQGRFLQTEPARTTPKGELMATRERALDLLGVYEATITNFYELAGQALLREVDWALVLLPHPTAFPGDNAVVAGFSLLSWSIRCCRGWVCAMRL